MLRLTRVLGLLWIGLWLSIVGCPSKPVPKPDPPSGATTQCLIDCASVSKSFLREHGQLFDENIRLKAALKLCQEKR